MSCARVLNNMSKSRSRFRYVTDTKNFIEKFTSSFILSSQLGPSQQQKTPTIIVGEIVYADILRHLYYY